MKISCMFTFKVSSKQTIFCFGSNQNSICFGLFREKKSVFSVFRNRFEMRTETKNQRFEPTETED